MSIVFIGEGLAAGVLGRQADHDVFGALLTESLGPPAGQAVGPERLYYIASPLLHVTANSTHD
jgi:hypothetical protein